MKQNRQERSRNPGGADSSGESRRTRRVRVPSPALRAGMRRSAETWRSVHLLPPQPGSWRAEHETLAARGSRARGIQSSEPRSRRTSSADGLWRGSSGVASRHFLRSAFNSLLAARRSSHPPSSPPSPPRLPGRTSHLSSAAPHPRHPPHGYHNLMMGLRPFGD